MFYQNQIQDAPNVLSISHEKTYLSGPMFGSYSFINVVGGREEKDENGRSRRNMVEVAIVLKIVQNLYKGVHIGCHFIIFNICLLCSNLLKFNLFFHIYSMAGLKADAYYWCYLSLCCPSYFDSRKTCSKV